MTKNLFSILIVEDSDEDYETLKRALKRINFSGSLLRCETGDEALDYLFQSENYTGSLAQTNLSLVLLDLNLPGSGGKAVLERMKQNERLRSIPVVILTTSSDELDIEDSYRKGASGFIKKPIGFNDFINTMKKLQEYWFEAVMLSADHLKSFEETKNTGI